MLVKQQLFTKTCFQCAAATGRADRRYFLIAISFVSHTGKACNSTFRSFLNRLQYLTTRANRKPLILNQRSYVIESQTQTTRDILLYRYKSDKFFIFVTLFAIVQCIYFWQLAYFAVTDVSSATSRPLPTNANWMVRVIAGQGDYNKVYSLMLFALGGLICYVAVLFTLRQVHTLHLLRGGRQLKITTFAPFGRTRSLIVSVNDTSSTVGRKSGTTFIPLKVKRHSLFYLIDRRGEFFNPTLFDVTAGMFRDLK